MSLPFGLTKGKIIFGTVASVFGGTLYTSYYYDNQSRRALADQVSFLAKRPCGVHEMPRKVSVYISAPPGDSLEKSRAWFRDYVKPVLVAGAVDYEVKEASKPGQIEAFVRDEILKLRREDQANAVTESSTTEQTSQNPFAPMMADVQKKIKQTSQIDGVLAIGRNAWREVLSGMTKGCEADPLAIEEPPTVEPAKTEEQTDATSADTDEAPLTPAESQTTMNDTMAPPERNVDEMPSEKEIKEELIDDLMTPGGVTTMVEEKDHFSLPSRLSPVMYIPHENIIGWTNIPYRLYMWLADYKRVERIGQYAVAAVLNNKRPLRTDEADVGQNEKVYWLGDEAQEALANDTPIVIDERIRPHLQTYTSDDLP
ncbi:mitochondrial import inner membrane translocase subunit Tim54 [Radiomyces spectabilis]|uniref:mitochondrial import inner membrane translocase subunit Tim54 n=1 Tax=Radiomyces spectabilis TaxID=64574 RepID=UPI00221FAEFA|nr:mitochondrial import inner membrane translocase subunit Tim54 [Radiomyces spectabilis]KAI8371383.1 mitochondrial import inner membrane translocase subunit Tim54 [Radiomyces spectabilis]